jgi:excisionase family DNA binding protein
MGYGLVQQLTSRLGGPQRMMESKMEDRWLSVDEIGNYVGIKRDTVYKWISEKSMPAHKIGRLWKFKKDEVDDWVRDGKARDFKEGEDQ